MNNFKYKEKEIIQSILISKYNFDLTQQIVKCNEISFLINIKDNNKLYSLIIYTLLIFLSYNNKPLFLNKNYRFFRRQSSFKKNNHLSFFFKLIFSKNSFFDFLQFYNCFFISKLINNKRKFNNNTLIISDFTFIRNVLRMILKLDNDIYLYLIKINFLLFFSFNNIYDTRIKLFYLKLLGLK